jgi:hypothetical protein
VNDSYLALNGAISLSPALVSFRFRDAENRDHRFIGHPTTVLFEPPRCLLFRIKSVTGTVAQIGSNDERFWVWIDTPELRKLWWGYWDDIWSGMTPGGIPIPPNQLLDVLMLRPLPEELIAGKPPRLEAADGKHRLLFERQDPQGRPYVAREVRLDPCPPYMPLEVIDRDASGRTLMKAEYDSYRAVGAKGPYTPRKYVVVWHDGAEMRLDVQNAKFREMETPFCDFPSGWQGEVERLVAINAPLLVAGGEQP